MPTYRWFVVAIVAFLLATGSRAAAQNGKSSSLSPEAYDRRVHAAIYKVTCEGVNLYNEGHRAAAAYYFQAAASSLVPFLDHRRELQEELQKAMADAEKEPDTVRRGLILHKALVRVSDATLVAPAASRIEPPRDRPDTLWQRLGGEEGVTGIINDFVEGAMRNRNINFTRNKAFLQTDEQVETLKRQLVKLTSALGKGPYKYEGRSMREIHKDMRITDAEFEELRKELHLALSSNKVSAADVIFILAGYDSTRPDIVTKRPEIVTVESERPRPGLRPIPTLWDELGGEEGVTKMMGELVDQLIEDKRVNFTRGDKYLTKPAEIAALKRQFVALASAVGKGKDPYKGKSMLDAHKGMGITDAEFTAFVDDLEKVLRQNKVKWTTIVLIKQLVENKRKDIVEKPQKTSGPVKEARPEKTSGQRPAAAPAKPEEWPVKEARPEKASGQAARERIPRERIQGSPGDVLLVYFLPIPWILFLLKQSMIR